MKRVALLFSALIFLTGCASSPSVTVEDQAKLVEYENCIKHFMDISVASYEPYANFLQACKSYRP